MTRQVERPERLDHLSSAEHDHLRVIRERGVGLPSLLEPSDEGRVDGRLATLEVESRQERDAGELPGVQMRLRPRRRT